MGNRWETKEDFISWVKNEREKADKTLHRCLLHFEKHFKDCASKGSIAGKNSKVDIKHFEMIVDDEILEHMNMYFSDIDINIFHIQLFILTIDSVRFFKESGFSHDPAEFKREIEQLKKRSNQLQYFSPEQIKIKLPRLPQDTLYSMISTLKRYGVEEQIIRYFYEFFKDRKRLPKKTKSYIKSLKLYDSILEEERLKDKTPYIGFYKAAEKINWHTPSLGLRYDGQNPLRNTANKLQPAIGENFTIKKL